MSINLFKRSVAVAAISMFVMLPLHADQHSSDNSKPATKMTPYERITPLMPYDKEFESMDKDKDKSLSKEEAATDYVLVLHYEVVDLDKSGKLELSEYKAYYDHRYGSIANTRPLKHLNQDSDARFNELDKNKDDVLSREEYAMGAIDSTN